MTVVAHTLGETPAQLTMKTRMRNLNFLIRLTNFAFIFQGTIVTALPYLSMVASGLLTECSKNNRLC